MAYDPEKTPVTLRSLMRSRSVRFFTYSMYSATASRCSSVVSLATSSLSGARTMKVTPKMVSARVVKIVKAPSAPPVGEFWFAESGDRPPPPGEPEGAILNSISVPSERPIQLRCVSLSDSVQSIVSSPSSRRCAYADTRRHHCLIFFCTTG